MIIFTNHSKPAVHVRISAKYVGRAIANSNQLLSNCTKAGVFETLFSV